MSDSDEHEKERARILASADQAGALLADTMPPVIHSFHVALVAQGFTEAQALELTTTFMLKMLGAYT